MQFVRFLTYIASCLSVARAFSVTQVGAPTQCGPLTVSWTGGQAPFEILLSPAYGVYQNYSVPSSAFNNGEGSYSISQLSLSTGTQFLLTMSDSTGFGSGGSTNQLTVGNPTTNNNCNTTPSSPSFTFSFSSPTPPTQCGDFTISTGNGAVLPITIVQLIPGAQPDVFYSNSDTSTFVVDVDAGKSVLYFVTDSAGKQGGVSEFETVSGSSDSSCLSPNSPSSTSGITVTITASPTSSSSGPNSTGSSSSPISTGSSSHSNVALIAGAAGGGGGAVLIALVILVLCLRCKRRASRSPDVQTSTTSHPRQLQRTDPKYEVSSYNDVPPQPAFPHKTNSFNYPTHSLQPSLGTQSDYSSVGNFEAGAPPSSFNRTQHLRQSSNTDSLVHGDARSSAMSSTYNQMSQPMSPNYPLQYPVGYPQPIRPGSQSPPLNTSTGNFTVNNHPALFSQTLHPHQSSNADFAVYGDARSSAAMSPADRRMTTIPETLLPLPWETGNGNYLGPPSQSGFQPSPINAPAADLAVRDPPTPFNQTQPSHTSSNTDFVVYGDAQTSVVTPVEYMAAGPQQAPPLPQKTELVYLTPPVQPESQSTSSSAGKVAVSKPPVSESQSMMSASAEPVVAAAGQTVYQPPTQFIVHTDVDDVVPNANGLVELPPQYSEHRGVGVL